MEFPVAYGLRMKRIKVVLQLTMRYAVADFDVFSAKARLEVYRARVGFFSSRWGRQQEAELKGTQNHVEENKRHQLAFVQHHNQPCGCQLVQEPCEYELFFFQ
jgi:hypothetical protein